MDDHEGINFRVNPLATAMGESNDKIILPFNNNLMYLLTDNARQGQ